MAVIEGIARAEGSHRRGDLSLEFQLPVFEYAVRSRIGAARANADVAHGEQTLTETPTGAMTRRLVSTVTTRHAVVAPEGTFAVHLPGESIIGSDMRAFSSWVRQVGARGMGFDVAVFVHRGPGRELIASSTLDVLFYADQPLGKERSATDADFTHRLFLINAAEFWRLVEEHGHPTGGSKPTTQVTEDDAGIAPLMALSEVGDIVGGVFRPRPVTGQDVDGIAARTGVTTELVDELIKGFDRLTRFDIDIPQPVPLDVAGTMTISGETDVSRRDLAFFHPVIDVPVLATGGVTEPRSIEADWPPGADPTALPMAFRFPIDPPVYHATIAGPVTVRVKGFDGVVLWRGSYAPADDELGDLKIVVDRYLPRPVEPAGPSDAAEQRRIRGQVVALEASRPVSALTVVIQARRAEDPNWRLVSAGQTDGSGYFAMPYPAGPYVAAQALVSLAPDVPTDIGIVAPDPHGSTLSDAFLYLLLDARDGAAAEDCGCGRHVGRLPDQADLIRSGDFTQDLGGGCINVSTPNRTLREYDFAAIVRASDPDVASYTLSRGASGQFELIRGPAKVDRAPVDLDNPIHWQDPPRSGAFRGHDPPEAGEAITFYQAVTVATGHILHFKAVFKADGYSLGDLVYSLPLAPGQKKQIVAYDVVNTLEASESQRIGQGERLAAELSDDRQITDELSGGITENIAGRSSAHTSGMSAGLGLAGSVGAISGSLGVAGGFANSTSSASQNGARGITQYFGERLRQALTQNAEAYRELNASVVTTVRDGQEYAVTTEVVANHNHCHSMTMMYFEVLRHYAICQELAAVQECLFVPLLLTEFTPPKVARWKDVLSASLLPVPAATYLNPLALRSAGPRRHPLLPAFDALDRVATNWTRVDYPTGSYAEDAVTSISGEFRLRIDLPRPPTRFDRILSLPVTSETRTSEQVDVAATVAAAIFSGGMSLLTGPRTDTVAEQKLVRAELFDLFMELDANFQSVPPADCIRVMRFAPQTFTAPDGTVSTLTFFQNDEDRRQWASYARLHGAASPEALLEQYFAGRLVSEWDTIFNRDLAPLLFAKILDTIHIEPLRLDATPMSRYRGGEQSMRVRVTGGGHGIRASMPERMRMHTSSTGVHAIRSFATLSVDDVTLRYRTAHVDGILFQGYAGGDLLDEDFTTSGVQLDTPLTSRDKRNPRKEDRYLADELVTHLNAHLEHYNKALWRGLDPDRRFMLLDGFSIQTYDRGGSPVGMRSLASVVKHELVDIAGNALVFPVADGYRVSQSLVVEGDGNPDVLRQQYEPDAAVPPYRLSVPTRGVYMDAVLGECDACEPVKPSSSQDWDEFRTDEPTAIHAVTTPTPQRMDWRAAWAQFASPLVMMQTPRDMPAPGAGLAGLSDALSNAEAFRDVTGLAGNQANAMQTFLSNQENARAFAEMAKGMAMQQHNSENSGEIMRSLAEARDNGALSEPDYQQMVRDHLGQQIDGGVRLAADERAREVQQPSLTNAAIQAVEDGRAVTATHSRPDGTTETVQVDPPGAAPFEPIHYDVPLIPQPNKTSCWAASMAMIESYRRSREQQRSIVVSAADLAAEVGYSLEQSYGWDRLESVKDLLDFDEIPLSGTQYPTAAQWRDWLASRGPLYVTIGGAPTHAIIVHGISGDGTPDGTHLEILNPWDIETTFDADPTQFRPPNTGLALRWSIAELDAKLNEGELDTLRHFERWRLLYQPANAPSASGPTTPPAPSGRPGARVFRIRALNRYLESDPHVAYTATVISATFNLDISVAGTGWQNVTDSIPDGEHVLVITPRNVEDVPADWSTFTNPSGTTPVAERIWTEERATITVLSGRVSALTGNDNIELLGGSVTVKLRPLWAHTPYRTARTAAPELILVHHTAGNRPLPPHFVGMDGPRAAAHYVIPRDGTIIKLADEATEAAWHAGEARWKGASDINARSIGIEIVHLDDTQDYETAQIDSLVMLLGQLRARFPAITEHDVIAHSDCSVNPADPHTGHPAVLAHKPLDPGKRMDWPRLEASRAGTSPVESAVAFATTSASDIYHETFKADPDRRMSAGSAGSAVGELKADLTTIGYYIASSGATEEYDDATGRAVLVFKYRFFSGARQQPDSFYDRRVDFATAQMIKRVLAAIAPWTP